MAGMNMNGGNGVMPGMPGMPLMNNGMNGATPRPGSEQDDSENEAKLNAFIYDYFLRNENWESARSLINSGVQMQPPPSRDGEVNGTDDNVMQTDSKEGMDSKRPDDLPPSKCQSDGQGASFLLDWFGVFWDIFLAQRRKPQASHQAAQYVHHSHVSRVPRNRYHQSLSFLRLATIEDASRTTTGTSSKRNAANGTQCKRYERATAIGNATKNVRDGDQ